MLLIVCALFCIGYIGIAAERAVRVDKAATALLMGGLCWVALAVLTPPAFLIGGADYADYATAHADMGGATLYRAWLADALLHTLMDAAQILFYLLSAMLIVELMDAHQAFSLLTDRIKTRKALPLLLALSAATFVLSAVLDNLTAAIVAISLLQKLVGQAQLRRLFAGILVVAANAGGAFSPIGDVTTTMLWMAGRITPVATISLLILPSLVALAVPLFWAGRGLGKQIATQPRAAARADSGTSLTLWERQAMLYAGVGSLLCVPVFHWLTGLPPVVGILLAAGGIWALSELLHHGRSAEQSAPYSAASALKRVDAPAILFFLGILLAVGALRQAGVLAFLASALTQAVGSGIAGPIGIGLLSAVVDNVPLVAATLGMYPGQAFPINDPFWLATAYCTGTGGSLLVIGSAAGVVAMAQEKLAFGWYARYIGLPALVGYLAGAGVLWALLHLA